MNFALSGAVKAASEDIPYDLNAPYVQGEILVKFTAGTDRAMAAKVAADHDCSIEESLQSIQLYRFKINNQQEVWKLAAELESMPDIEYAEPNFIVEQIVEPVVESMENLVNDQNVPIGTASGDMVLPDPLYGDQWHYDLINMPDAWKIITGGPGVIAAVLDTGRLEHLDLAARFSNGGYDFIDNDPDPTDSVLPAPTQYFAGHGTFVSGIVGAVTNNGTGVAGMTWTGDILPIRAGISNHFSLASAICYACGILYAPGDPVNPTPVGVFNLSMGTTHSNVLENAISLCNTAGVIMVCAAGNANLNSVDFPAAYSLSYNKVIAVGATDYNCDGAPPSIPCTSPPRRASYSNYGPQINVVAPGGDKTVDSDGDGNVDGVLSTGWVLLPPDPGSIEYIYELGYKFDAGTSFAAPHVTGLVALMLAHGANPDNVRSIIQSTARDLGPSGWDPEFGHGLIDARAALEAVPKIAVIQSSASTVNSVDKALNDLGKVFEKFNTADFSSINLSRYNTVIVAMGEGNPDTPDIAHLANYANTGGNLVMVGGAFLYSFVTAVDTHLLDIDTTSYSWEMVTTSPDFEITDPLHPLAKGLPETYDFNNNNASAYMIRSQDTAAEEAAVNGNGETALLKKKMSNGGALTWFINMPTDTIWDDTADYDVLKQIIKNALELSFKSPDDGTKGLAYDGIYLRSIDSGDGTSMRGEAYYQINPNTGAVVEMWLRPAPAVSGPFGMTFDGTNIWSSDGSGGHMIYKHNPVDMSIINSFVSPRANPADLAWDGESLWAVISGSGPIIKINPATGAETGSIPIPPSALDPFGLTYANGCLYLGDKGSDTIYKLNPVTGEVLDSWPSPGPDLTGLAFDGNYLWVSDGEANRIYRMMGIVPFPGDSIKALPAILLLLDE
ncbi:MAG: S8 family serine peptidase [Gammaproteobacteria bacterium]|nr:S8 family serine peptidase [Gammaproteobacteria bacterium]